MKCYTDYILVMYIDKQHRYTVYCVEYVFIQVMILFHQGLFFSNRPDLEQIVPGESFFWSTRLSSWIASNRPLSDRVDLLKNSRRWKTVVPWSSEDLVRVVTLRRHYAQPSVESGRGYTKAPEGETRGPSRDLGRPRRPRTDGAVYMHYFGKYIGHVWSSCSTFEQDAWINVPA